MLEPLDDLPDGVIGFEAVGEIHAADYRSTLDPAIDAAVEAGRKIRLLYLLGERFTGYSGGAAWEDAKVGIGSIGHLGTFERTAIVSDVDWIDHLASAFGWMMPGRFRRFPLSQLDDAVTWVATED